MIQRWTLHCFLLWLLFSFSLEHVEALKIHMAQGSSSKVTSPVLQKAVSFLTFSLNTVLKEPEINTRDASLPMKTPTKLSTVYLLKGLREDYKNDYFLTGQISDELYSEDCTFVDPTISFTGLSVWKRNIANLKLFFIDPSIELLDIKLEKDINGVRAKWILNCILALPWRPQICVGGSTLHTYSPAEGNRVVLHEESWDISALEAVLQIFRPSLGKAS